MLQQRKQYQVSRTWQYLNPSSYDAVALAQNCGLELRFSATGAGRRVAEEAIFFFRHLFCVRRTYS